MSQQSMSGQSTLATDAQMKQSTDSPMSANMSSHMAPHDKEMMKVTDDLGIDEPQNWPVTRKISVSLAACGYAFALLYGATCYTAGLDGIAHEFGASQTQTILGFSLYIFGIMFAPLYAPHVSEKVGRNLQYRIATLGLGVFTLGAAYSKTYPQLAICRFFAGLLGGSNVVQIEGTLADVWPALYTNSYYAFIACAQYFGAATGAIVGWHVVPAENWRWTQYTTLMFVLAALVLGAGVPETYRRELVRRKAKALHQPNPLMPALSGETIGEMARYTIIDPVITLIKEPIVLMITLFMGLNFGVLFSFFILVPVVLQGVAKFTPQMVGTAFITAIVGTVVGAIFAIVIDQAAVRFQLRRHGMHHMIDIEHRMIVVMVGAIFLITSLFWIGWTANANFKPIVPIVGNGAYVAGSVMILTGFIPYLFDAYKPQGILSALTAAACFRVGMAGAIPLTILISVGSIGGNWTLGTYGFIAIAFLPFPFVIFFFGKRLRNRSSFRQTADDMSPMHKEMQMMAEQEMSHPQPHA